MVVVLYDRRLLSKKNVWSLFCFPKKTVSLCKRCVVVILSSTEKLCGCYLVVQKNDVWVLWSVMWWVVLSSNGTVVRLSSNEPLCGCRFVVQRTVLWRGRGGGVEGVVLLSTKMLYGRFVAEKKRCE